MLSVDVVLRLTSQLFSLTLLQEPSFSLFRLIAPDPVESLVFRANNCNITLITLPRVVQLVVWVIIRTHEIGCSDSRILQYSRE